MRSYVVTVTSSHTMQVWAKNKDEAEWYAEREFCDLWADQTLDCFIDETEEVDPSEDYGFEKIGKVPDDMW